MLRQWQLNENPIDHCVCVQRVDKLQQLFFGGFGRQSVFIALYAADFACLLLVVDVNTARGVVADDDYRKSYVKPVALYLCAYFFLYSGGNCLSVDYLCCHLFVLAFTV